MPVSWEAEVTTASKCLPEKRNASVCYRDVADVADVTVF